MKKRDQLVEPRYTVTLRVRDDTDTIYYRVAVEDNKEQEVSGFMHSSENYNEAFAYARIFFDELSQREKIIASYIEQPGMVTGQGALFSIGSFAAQYEDIVSDEEFYKMLAHELIANIIRGPKRHINVIFRHIIQRHKLDIYKEKKFFQYLENEGIIKSEEDDVEGWLERQQEEMRRDG